MKLLSKFFISIIFILTAQIARAEFKMGLVDLQKAISSTHAGKKAKTEFEGERDKKKKDLDKKKADVDKMYEDLDKKKGVLSEEALQKKQMELNEEAGKFRQSAEKAQQELIKKEQELTKPILEKMKKVIDRLAKAKGMSVIMENNPAILFYEQGYDLTDEVVKAFESEK